MEMLGEEASEEQLREAKLQHRRKIMSRVRVWCGFLVFAGALAYGYVRRDDLQNYCYDKFFAKDTKPSSAETAANATISQVQATANKRDSILNEIESNPNVKVAAEAAASANTAGAGGEVK
jgi:hypothetical protein